MTPPSDLNWTLPPDLDARVRERLNAFRQQDVVRRIWAKDASVWSGTDEARWLGWLTLPRDSREGLARLTELSAAVKRDRLADVVLMGMGGSSLAPEVMRNIIGVHDGHPNLHVVDSTDPAQILHVERAIDFDRTLFVVASKSGSTLEVNILKQYFYQRAVEKFGAAGAGSRFVLTTDPGSKMQTIGQEEGFREIFPGIPSVGGRYSALSNFGLVPAAAIGTDVRQLLDRAEAMATQCQSSDDVNAALRLGVVLGEAALAGRDKPTLIGPPALASFGAWLEQLVAESLGKQGRGIIPIDGEALGSADVYGNDRVFVQFRSSSAPDASASAGVERLERAGQPIVRIDWPDRYALGAEFFRWEFATAVMGAVLGVNPFDQPDVEASKIVTRRIADEYEKTGTLAGDSPLRVDDEPALGAQLKNLLSSIRAGDYFAVLAFIEMNEANRRALDSIRAIVRDRKKVATTVGFGPRFLHSTGQAHKGGPSTGVFLQITCDDPEDLAVPGQRYTFGTIKRAQALGDLEVMASRGRRVLRVHLTDIHAGLRKLHAAIQQALP